MIQYTGNTISGDHLIRTYPQLSWEQNRLYWADKNLFVPTGWFVGFRHGELAIQSPYAPGRIYG